LNSVRRACQYGQSTVGQQSAAGSHRQLGAVAAATVNAPAHRPNKLRRRLFELGREYPAERLIENVLRPLSTQLSGDHELLQMLRGMLEGIIIEYATFCMDPHTKKTGPTALLLG